MKLSTTILALFVLAGCGNSNGVELRAEGASTSTPSTFAVAEVVDVARESQSEARSADVSGPDLSSPEDRARDAEAADRGELSDAAMSDDGERFEENSEDVAAPLEAEDVALERGEFSWPEGLYGSIPPSALPLPDFVALNHDGQTRGPEDLIGKPTVMWFFPFAGTPG